MALEVTKPRPLLIHQGGLCELPTVANSLLEFLVRDKVAPYDTKQFPPHSSAKRIYGFPTGDRHCPCRRAIQHLGEDESSREMEFGFSADAGFLEVNAGVQGAFRYGDATANLGGVIHRSVDAAAQILEVVSR